jgi:hypothetical protein
VFRRFVAVCSGGLRLFVPEVSVYVFGRFAAVCSVGLKLCVPAV